MERVRIGSGTPFEAMAGASRAVRVGRWVHVAGSPGAPPEGGSLDAADQARAALEDVRLALEALGARMEDVVRTRVHLTRVDRDASAVATVHGEAFGGVRPVMSLVGVAGLPAAWMLVAIEAEAVIGSGARVRDGSVPAVREAGLNDAPAVAALLRASGLPVPGERDRPVSALVVERDGRIAGCVGYEDHGPDALLRSLAVHTDHRGRRLATLLVRALLRRLARRGVQRVWLLTMLDESFFAKLGFRATRRDAVPFPVRRSHEFAIHACDAATVMTRVLDGGDPLDLLG